MRHYSTLYNYWKTPQGKKEEGFLCKFVSVKLFNQSSENMLHLHHTLREVWKSLYYL